MSDKWNKMWLMSIEKGNAYLSEILFNESNGRSKLMGHSLILPTEYGEYVEDSMSWVSFNRGMNELSMLHHWSGIRKIRIITNILSHINKDEEMVWMYKGEGK